MNVVETNWCAPIFPNADISGMAKLWNKLSRLKQVLRWWNKNLAENEVLDLENVVMLNPDSANISELNNAKIKNTKFFHSLANKKRVRNHIFKITNANGCILEEEEAILQSEDINQEGTLNPYIVSCGISDTDNLHLSMVPSEDEVWKVMQAMNGDSVAGPDGFTTTFFIKTWHIIKKDILDAICDFFSGNPYIKSNVSLWAKFMHAKYCHDRHPTICTVKASDSSVWKRLMKVTVLSVLTDWMSNVRGNVLNILPICIIWFLWKARNEAKHDGIKMKDTDLCVKLGMSIHLEDVIRRERIVRWLKPKAPAIKLNSDGSVDTLSAGFGGIIRDSFGKVIVAYAGPLSPCMVIYAELMGLLKGLIICIKRGFIYVEIEVNALNVIQIINTTHISYPQFFYLIREIKFALSNLNFTLAHLLREGNACADALAKLGSTLEEEREFDMENLPMLRLNLLVNLGFYFEIGMTVFLLDFKFLGYISLKAYLRATIKLLDQVGILNNCKEDGAEC
ncbi:hypothetical protein KFK09_004845 [Dendrobium nobile]|uniref:RNase H type-1 domain-containing protein n=1 Tax=Dendrobium nobile TaxID=94219 RepID=A0A8T3BZM1_DENNO|nr:hypothetical protein KFK09_004845 [Dendrobium nobile]